MNTSGKPKDDKESKKQNKECRHSSNKILLVLGFFLVIWFGWMFFCYIPANHPRTIVVNITSKLDENPSPIQQDLKTFISQELDGVNRYVTVVSIVVALLAIFATIISIGVSLSLGFKEQEFNDKIKDKDQELQVRIKIGEQELNRLYDKYEDEIKDVSNLRAEIENLIYRISDLEGYFMETIISQIPLRLSQGSSLLEPNNAAVQGAGDEPTE